MSKRSDKNRPRTVEEYGQGLMRGLNDGRMFKFTPETSSNWAGPFEGHCAVGGWRNRGVGGHRNRLFLDVLDFWIKVNAKARKPVSHEILRKTARGEPSIEYPIEVVFYGNDDTSYTLCMPSEAEAKELLALLEAGEPLDFNKDFLPFGFIFTN